MSSKLVSQEHRIPSCRGLVLGQTANGKTIPPHDIKRMLRYNRMVLNAEKADYLALGSNISTISALLPSAKEMGLTLSLRTDATSLPPDIQSLKNEGLWDIHLTPANWDEQNISPWLSTCQEAHIPVRLQIPLPFPTHLNPEEWATELANISVIAIVRFAITDPFITPTKQTPGSDTQAQIQWAEKAIAELEKHDIEASFLHAPFCYISESTWANTLNEPQRNLDHNDYIPAIWDMTKKMWHRSLQTNSILSRSLLSRNTLHKEVVDTLMLPLLLRNGYLHMMGRLYRRLTIRFDIFNRLPDETDKTAIEKAQQEANKKHIQSIGKECAQCALRTICDTSTKDLERALPGIQPKAIPGDHVVSPLHYNQLSEKYYDEIDAERLEWKPFSQSLAEEAIELVTSTPPDKTYTSADYSVEGAYVDKMEAGIKWWSITHSEKLSTLLGEFTPPLTISVDVGAGIADYFGFSFGRHCKIVCPLEAYRHHFILHVNAEGQYVLIRDRHLVHPSEFEGEIYLPLRLGNTLQPRLSAWNIDNCIATSNLKIWTHQSQDTQSLDHIKYSIIIVSTKFTRRLQAVLKNLAHQENFNLSSLEVIICYVPGIDATDDLIDSVTDTYPEIRFVRSPFPEKYMRSKGFLINESAKLVHGEWIMLLDSDTLLPPDYFSRIEAVSHTEDFIAPDGRRLLPPNITSKILMGEINPWECWDQLMSGEGDFRHRETQGVPVGFCQCFRAKYLNKFPYIEVDHFETADMHFGMEMLKELKQEYRMSGRPVLHLDHGGSQWYGAQKHM